MFRRININPHSNRVDDCVVRAIALAANMDWEEVYDGLYLFGRDLKAMPNTNFVWDAYLRHIGFKRYVIPNTCPDCYTVRMFCEDNPHSTVILCTGTHAVCAIEGDYFDTWDSGNEVPLYFYERT